MAAPVRYDTLPAFSNEVQTLANTDPESYVSGIWNLILNHYFPLSDGYVHRPEDHVQGGFVDINTHQWINPPQGVIPPVGLTQTQCYFLITQCKSMAREDQPGIWEEAQNQLHSTSQL